MATRAWKFSSGGTPLETVPVTQTEFLGKFDGKRMQKLSWKDQLLSCNSFRSMMTMARRWMMMTMMMVVAVAAHVSDVVCHCQQSLYHVKYILKTSCQSCMKCLHKYAILCDDTWCLCCICVFVFAIFASIMESGYERIFSRTICCLAGTCLWDSSLAWRRLQSIWTDIDYRHKKFQRSTLMLWWLPCVWKKPC